MRDTINSVREKAHSRGVTASNVAVVALVVLALASGVAVAQQSQQTYSDDFEDGDVDGWVGENFNISTTSTEGSYSLEANDGVSNQDENPEWGDGPVLDLTDEFTVEGTARIDQGQGNARVGFGIARQGPDGAEGVMLLFSDEYNETFIAQNNEENSSGLQSIQGDFDGEWVNWEFTSDGDGLVKAKVWRVGEAEPSSYQIERQMDPDSGLFTVFVGTTDISRTVWLDGVTIDGTEATDPDLDLEHSNLLLTGEQTNYEVKYKQYNDQLGRNETIDVTNDSDTTVESSNTSVVTVHESNATLSATGNGEVSTRVDTRAQYNGSVDYNYVTVVPEATVEHLDVLPPVYRIGAFLGDWTVFLLIITTGAGIVGTRAASAFMGLSMAEMVLVVGWFGGYITRGLLLVSLFAALFIGLNLAANIDYTVRR